MGEAEVEGEIVAALEAAMASSGDDKAGHLSRAKELLLYQLPGKLAEYFPLLLEFQTSPEAVVKARVVAAVIECTELAPRLDFLTAATGCVRHLLNDAFPSVVKAALAGARLLVALSLHALTYAPPAERAAAHGQWTALCGVLATLTDPLLTRHANLGVKLMTFKLLEQIVLMTERLAASRRCRDALAKLAKPSVLRGQPEPCQIVLLMAHASLALKRPSAAEEPLNVLLQAADSLRNAGAANVEGARGGRGRSSVASVRKACAEALLLLLKAEEPALEPLEPRVLRGLTALQADEQAQEVLAKRRKAAKKRALEDKREADDGGEPAAKRAAPAADAAYADARGAAAPDAGADAAAASAGLQPQPQYAAEVKQVASHVPRLLCQAGLDSVMEFVKQLDPAILIELVMSRMAHLPAECPADGVTVDGCVAEQQALCAERIQRADPAPALAVASAAPPPLEPPPAEAVPPPAPASAVVKQEPDVAVLPELPGAAAAPLLPDVKPEAPAPPARPAPRLALTRIDDAARGALQRAALDRILGAPRALLPAGRARLAARLVPSAAVPQGLALLQRFEGLLASGELERALELATSLLYSLFVKQCSRLLTVAVSADAGAASGGAEAAAAYLSALESLFGSLFKHTVAETRMPDSRLPPFAALAAAAPLLPEGALRNRLDWLCGLDSAWGKVALVTMRELIKARHALKLPMLRLAIATLLAMRDPELKSSTMRMLANQVYPILTRDEAALLETAAAQLLADFVEAKLAAAAPEGRAELERFDRALAKHALRAAELYAALCLRRPATLLRRLFDEYAKDGQDPHVQAALVKHTELIGRGLPADSRAVLTALAESPTEHAAPLRALLTGILAATGGMPPPPLVDAGLAFCERTRDLRVAALLLPGMPPGQALAHIGALVRLPMSDFRAAVKSALVRPDGSPGLVRARDVLTHLHTLDPSSVEASLSQVGQAISECVKATAIFTQQTVLGVLSQLSLREPLPPLIMRTLINAWHAHPAAHRYLLDTVADQLASRKALVEDDGVLWAGFVLFASFAISIHPIRPAAELLLKLPAARLEKLLADARLADRSAKAKLRDYVSRLHDRRLDSEVLIVLGLRTRDGTP